MLDKFREISVTWDHATNQLYERLRTASSDDGGRKLVVQITNNKVVQNTSEVEMRLYWEIRDKKGFNDFDLVDAENGIYEIYFTRGMLENIGTHKAWLHTTDTTGSITSEVFGIEVFSGIDLEAVEGTDDFSALNSALARVVAIESQEEERQANETARKQAENARVTVENTRKNAETAREANEDDRQTNETARESAEVARENAESTRQSNEADRIAFHDDMEDKLQSGYFKGDKGDDGEKGDKGDKGDKGEQGDVSLTQLNNAINPIKTKTDTFTTSGDQVNFKETPTVNGKPLLWFGIVEEI